MEVQGGNAADRYGGEVNTASVGIAANNTIIQRYIHTGSCYLIGRTSIQMLRSLYPRNDRQRYLPVSLSENYVMVLAENCGTSAYSNSNDLI